MKPSGTRRWRRVIALALAAVPTALAWRHFHVEREYHALWMLLHRARTQAMRAGPVTVRFTDYRAVIEDRAGDVLEWLFLATLHEVRYRTTQGDGRIVFGAGGGQTSPYNVHLHGRRHDAEIVDRPGTLAVGAWHRRDHPGAE